jgi:hypothetical protein
MNRRCLCDTSRSSRFSRNSRESRRYNTMPLFTMSIRPLGMMCAFPSGIMTQGRTMFGAVIAVGFILIFPHQIPAQQWTAPPSSLATRPLTPESSESELRPSCDLCRKPEGRPGSDVRPNRSLREKGLRPHKNPKGTHRSFDQSLKSLPRRPLHPQKHRGGTGMRNHRINQAGLH